jgi:hypothetical protein
MIVRDIAADPITAHYYKGDRNYQNHERAKVKSGVGSNRTELESTILLFTVSVRGSTRGVPGDS